jgi:hypothetical protein
MHSNALYLRGDSPEEVADLVQFLYTKGYEAQNSKPLTQHIEIDLVAGKYDNPYLAKYALAKFKHTLDKQYVYYGDFSAAAAIAYHNPKESEERELSTRDYRDRMIQFAVELIFDDDQLRLLMGLRTQLGVDLGCVLRANQRQVRKSLSCPHCEAHPLTRIVYTNTQDPKHKCASCQKEVPAQGSNIQLRKLKM